MSGIIGLSISEKNKNYFITDLFKATFYQQHWNEEWAGLASFGRGTKQFNTDSQQGLFRANFEKRMGEFKGTEGIGYCGVAKEPFEIDTRLGKMCLCFSGTIRNHLELKEKLKKERVSFSDRSGNDLEIEVIANLIAQGRNIVDGIKVMTGKIEGTYTILILTGEGIFAARSPDGHWCLTIGQKEGETIVASSSAGFNNLGLRIIRELEPGEIVLVKDSLWETKEQTENTQVRVCSFLGVYSDFPAGKFQGIPISLIRKRLGAALARRDIEKGFIPDIVAPVPDSGRFHAIGYHQEFCRANNRKEIDKVPLYDEILLKWAYAGRSFTPQNENKRKTEADLKIIPSSEDYSGKIVVLADDSIVRGTQTKSNLIPKLMTLGVKEIHLRISNPELFSHCSWGKTTKQGECLAVQIPLIADRIKFLGVNSLEYNSIDELVKAIGLPRVRLCIDCSLSQP